MKIIKLPEFAERLRQRLDDNRQEVVWFLGAGCSISSGIKAAGGLVDDWLDELHRMRAADQDRNAWARSAFKNFDPKKAALHYAEVFEERHPNAADRQQAIERICARGEAAYGYATLAQIITDDRIGSRCNTVLTTNFDDLLVEAIYMYGTLRVRPQIITHEAVAHYARLSQTRPTIIKVHGDAHLDPKNLRHETATLDEAVAAHLHAFIKNATLVFLGYGGNDQSIVRFLTECPWPPLPQPIYWVGTDDPSPDMAGWLETHEAVRVDHRDFDVAMHMLRVTLDIPHPDESRWTRAKDRYLEALRSYDTDKKAERDSETRKALREAAEKSKSTTPPSAWGYAAQAMAAHDDPDHADQIYREGIRRFPHNPILLGNYALFLKRVRKDMEGAETFYKRALAADPNDANNLGNYANFMMQVRKDMDGAEALHKRAVEADPNHANNLSNYANFMSQVRKDMDAADALYQRALDADPNDANALGNYSQLSLATGQKEGLKRLDQATAALANEDGAIQASLAIELAVYAYAHDTRQPIDKRLEALKARVRAGNRSLDWDFSANVERAERDGHPQIDLLKAVVDVVSHDAPVETLDAFPEWKTA